MSILHSMLVGYDRWRRRVHEMAGSRKYSRPALDGLDLKLERHLDFDGGYFVEAGANDGYHQSNTYYLERWRGWRGVLVEGIPALADACRINRPHAIVVEAALVAGAQPGDTVTMHFGGLMSAVAGALGTPAETQAHVRRGVTVQELRGSYDVSVPARTLSDVLVEVAPDREIDLLSLDVEGMEAAVLRGLDLHRHAPRFICVEVRNRAEVAALLAMRYQLVEVLADHGERADLLFERA